MHVGMAAVAILFAFNAAIRFDLKSVVLGFIIVPALVIGGHALYKMRDPHMVHHRNRIYYRGPGTGIRVRYSQYVPMNLCVEMYADDCHVASLYRGNEDAVTVPPGTDRIIFMLEDLPIGEFSPASIEGGCFYICLDERKLPQILASVGLTDSFNGIDTGSEERSYKATCKELRKDSLANLFWFWTGLLRLNPNDTGNHVSACVRMMT